jgi:hypothetical protein
MVNFTFLFLTLLSFQANAQNICNSYEWPNSIKEILKLNGEMKQKALGEEIDEFSRKVGTCYDREPVGLAEKTWCEVKRDQNIEKIFLANGLKNLCNKVKKYLVDTKLPNSKKDPSPYCQYANCGEGQYVAACLAYQMGYRADEIRLCDSQYDHAWTLVPEVGKTGSYCLLDRWNTFRCGVKLQGKQEDSYIWRGDVKVPGKVKFQFAKSVCTSFSTYQDLQ